MNNNLAADVLLVTVTDVETESLLAAAKAKTGQDYVPRPIGQKTYFDLGVIGGVRVIAVRSEMGSDTVGGSLVTVKDAIDEVKPSSVIMVGIAFGVDESKQKIGDVLVAKQLQPYELQRVGTSATGERRIILRGDKPHCSEKLLDRLRATRLKWKKADVEFGLVLSGEKLIDNIDFRDQLRALSEEAIGGEMEGGGLYVAAQQGKVDWILVKAICDWADGKKHLRRKARQRRAAENAADFVIEMLASGALASDPQALTEPIQKVAENPRTERPPLSADHISIARLPTGGNELFGRDRELKLLDDAWNNPNTNVVSFVAWAGVGKTALVNHWLKKRMARDNYRGAERVYGWSFFSQGTSERAASADLFIDQALRWFGDEDPTAGSPWDKGERLAGYIRQTRTLLILDGLEPLQHPPGAYEGRLKDPAMQALLVELAAQQPGLCVISTRERIGDLIEFEDGTAIRHDLEQLSAQAGAKILRSLNVKGDDSELEEASREMDGHAFSLTLLGSYLDEVMAGDIRRRKEIENVFEDTRYGGAAERMIAAYEKWLGEGMELSILRLLGFFDRPADASSIATLREPPAIPGLSESLQHFKAREWNQAVAKLRRIKLLAEPSPNEPGTLDAHPLLREHFKQQLKRERTDTWCEGNSRLYEYLKNTTKEFPDTMEEMSPLYVAVAHGCAAGQQQEALLNVYFRRIQRESEHFNWLKLGAYSADLAVLSNFFDVPWKEPIPGLTPHLNGLVLGESGQDLRALGRLQEAVQPLRASQEAMMALGVWIDAAAVSMNISELYVTIGDLTQSVAMAKLGVELADRSDSNFMAIHSRARLAHAHHQAGDTVTAAAMFSEAEALQAQADPAFPILYSVSGYLYCDLLLDSGQVKQLNERATRCLELGKQQFGPLSVGLDHLSLGCASLLEMQLTESVDSKKAGELLQRAVDRLRQAGHMEFLPRGLLARAKLYRFKRDYGRAQRDLGEVYHLAARSEMGLHLADYHLESARLRLAQGDKDKAREHAVTAKEMIEKMGYHRRDKEVKELEEELAR